MITTLLASFALGLPQMPAEALDAWASPAGLRVLRTHLPEGDIVVYLPSRMSAGETISGSVYMEPAGESQSRQASNAMALAKHSIDATGTTINVGQPQFTLRTPENGSPLSLTVRSEDGGTAARMTVDLSAGTGSDEPAACPVVEQGTAIRIVGRFDGKRDTTYAWIDGVPTGVIAEGSRDCIVSTMGSDLGSHRLKVRDNGVESEHVVNVVRVEVKTPTDARIGRKTAIEVRVDGLEGADMASFPLRVVLKNSMPKLFPFGEGSEMLVDSREVVAGRWTGKLEFKPKKKGEFSMSSLLICDAFLKRIGETN